MPVAAKSVEAGHDLLRRVSDSRRRSDELLNLVHPQFFYERPIPERHRIIFYLGHLEAFDWNLLRGSALDLKAFHPEFDRLFAFGIDPVGGGLPTDRAADWPSLESVRDYVTRVRTVLDDKLTDSILDSDQPARDGFPFSTLLNVAIEHRLMHVETLAYMLHQLPLDRKLGQPEPPPAETAAVVHRMMEIPAGPATLGLRRDDRQFGWDNEYERHTVQVPAFEVGRYKVTNQQYLEFVIAGGYSTREFWSEDDWNWKTDHGIVHPVFWSFANDQWFCRTMFDEIPLPLSWPVYVSYAEAMAYARWAGKSLPTEAQWHRAAYGTPDGQWRPYPWGHEAPRPPFGNFDFQRWGPVSVAASGRGMSAFGLEDMLGNGWEWTSTVFTPFQGFEPFPFYRGYSADFFDGKHFILKGGSSRTAACMLRSTFRNWFQAHYQYVYAGFRCVNQ